MKAHQHGLEKIGRSTGSNGGNEFTDFPHIAPHGSKGSEPDRYASPPGAKTNGTGLHQLDLEQSEEIGHSTGNNGKNVTFRPGRRGIYPIRTYAGRLQRLVTFIHFLSTLRESRSGHRGSTVWVALIGHQFRALVPQQPLRHPRHL